MAKSKSFLSGVNKEYRAKITALRNEGRKAAAAEKEKDSEKHKDGLYKVRTAFLRAMEDAKKAGEIPKTTTIDKIGKLPKEVPSRWSTTYKRIFGRKSPLGKPTADKPAEKTAPKKKARSKAKSKK